MARPFSLCTFRVAGHAIGLPSLRIQEVTRRETFTPVPLAPEAVLGLVNLRGQIVTAIDLRRRLGLADVRGPSAAGSGPEDGLQASAGGGRLNVVVETEDGLVSLVVDEIGDVFDADADRLLAPPATLLGPIREVSTGVLPLGDGAGELVLILDPDAAARLA